jgi:hypothetical protein
MLSDDDDPLPPLKKAPMPASPHRIRLPSITSNSGNLLRKLDGVEGNQAKATSAVMGIYGDAGAHQHDAEMKSEQKVAEDQRYFTHLDEWHLTLY